MNCISTSGTAVGIAVDIAVATLTNISHIYISTATREAVAATKIIVNTCMTTGTSKKKVSAPTPCQRWQCVNSNQPATSIIKP